MTGLLEAGEIPQVRKVAALLGLHRLHGAFAAVQKHALAILLFRERKPASITREPGVTLDEFHFAESLVRRETRGFAVGQAHVARPPAAGSAALAFVKDRHGAKAKQLPHFSQAAS